MWHKILSSISKRPVTVILLMSVVIFLGVLAWRELPVDLLPMMDVPFAVVITPYIGAGPEEVEANVTNTLEGAIMLVGGIKEISSRSMDGFSVIEIEFDWDTDISLAMLRIREAVDAFSGELPEGANPMVFELNPALLPVYIIGISAPSAEELVDLSNSLRMTVSQVEGVANVDRMGIPDREIRVDIQEGKLEEFDIPFDVLRMVFEPGARYPFGRFEEEGKYYTLSVNTNFKNIKELSSAVIGFRGMGELMNTSSMGLQEGFDLDLPDVLIPVRLNQIASVSVADVPLRGTVRVNGKESSVLVVFRQGGANTVDVARRIREALSHWEELHSGATVYTITDTSVFTESAISGLFRNLLMGAIVATIVIFVFLRNLGATLIIAASIPLSLTMALVFMFFSRLGLDLMTVGGLTMGVGMLVDNSIVVLEAIFRHLEKGKEFSEAAGKGGSEVAGAIIASTATTLAMFVPFAFITGFAAQIFKFFALALAFTLAGSLLVALTIIPGLTQFISHKKKRSVRTGQWYSRSLDLLLRRKLATVVVFLLVFTLGLTGLLLKGLDFIPKIDNSLVTVNVTLPDNTPYHVTADAIARAEEYLLENRNKYEITQIYTTSGQTGDLISALLGGAENMGSVQISLVPPVQRDRSSEQIAAEIRDALSAILDETNARIDLSYQGLELEALFGKDMVITLFDQDLDQLVSSTERVKSLISGVDGLQDLGSSFDQKHFAYQIDIDRSKALLSGVYFMQALGTLQPYTIGLEAGNIFVDGVTMPIKIYRSIDELSSEKIERLKVPSMIGDDVYMGMISSIKVVESPMTIFHRGGQRVSHVDANVVGRALSDVEREIVELLEEDEEISSMRKSIGGQAYLMREAVDQFVLALIIGLVLMYLIIGAQFESFVYPLIIFFTIPMSLVGVTLVTFLLGLEIDISALVGMLTVAGLTVNNGIVMVTNINYLRFQQGLPKRQAIIEGAEIRSRPIIMTTLTTAMALVPMAFSRAEGAEINRSLAIMIIGGLVVGMVFTLFFMPIVYDLVDRLSSKKAVQQDQ